MEKLGVKGIPKYVIDVSLQHIMDNLPDAAFIKCKRSVIINICYYRSYRKNPPMVVMDDGQKFNLSKKNMIEFEMMTKRIPRISPPCKACYSCTDIDCESQVVFCRRKKHSNTTNSTTMD